MLLLWALAALVGTYVRCACRAQEEAAEHRDILVVRGVDTYLTLHLKVLAIFRYAYASPAGKRRRQCGMCRWVWGPLGQTRQRPASLACWLSMQSALTASLGLWRP